MRQALQSAATCDAASGLWKSTSGCPKRGPFFASFNFVSSLLVSGTTWVAIGLGHEIIWAKLLDPKLNVACVCFLFIYSDIPFLLINIPLTSHWIPKWRSLLGGSMFKCFSGQVLPVLLASTNICGFHTRNRSHVYSMCIYIHDMTSDIDTHYFAWYFQQKCLSQLILNNTASICLSTWQVMHHAAMPGDVSIAWRTPVDPVESFSTAGGRSPMKDVTRPNKTMGD